MVILILVVGLVLLSLLYVLSMLYVFNIEECIILRNGVFV